MRSHRQGDRKRGPSKLFLTLQLVLDVIVRNFNRKAIRDKDVEQKQAYIDASNKNIILYFINCFIALFTF